MLHRTAAAALMIAVLCCVAGPTAQPRIMPLREVRAGMTGVGRTIFQGTELSEFKVHVLGVLENIQGPKRNLILARLEGGPLAETGVAAGMSGSPVYIDGRLVGAVGYSIGAFPKEAIAGITPIEEMKDATDISRRPTAAARVELPITPDAFATALRRTFSRVMPTSASPAAVSAIGIPRSEAAQLAALLRPIGTPLLLSGFEPETVALVASMVRDSGLAPMAGAASAGGATAEELAQMKGPLREGDAVGVALVSGDLEMGATGTVTHIDGDRVYAFGHPFFGLGPVDLPMRRAYVYTMLPSLMSSFKISTMGEVIGAVRQDRATAIAGTLGPAPATIPMTVTLRSTRGGRTSSQTFRFEVANDQTFSPVLAYVTLFNTLTSYERQFGTATFTLKGRARVRGHADLAFEDIFAGEAPTLAAATSIGGPLNLLLTNDREPVRIESLDFTVDAAETALSATIERVWIDELKPRPGKTVPVKILTRNYRGEETISTVPVLIPSNIGGSVSIVVSDGRALDAYEQREVRRTVPPQSVAQMIRLLNQTRRNNRIYVRVLTGAPGAVVNGEVLGALPPSVLSVLESDRNGGSFSPLRSAAVGEYEVPMNAAITGSRTLTLDLESR